MMVAIAVGQGSAPLQAVLLIWSLIWSRRRLCEGTGLRSTVGSARRFERGNNERRLRYTIVYDRPTVREAKHVNKYCVW